MVFPRRHLHLVEVDRQCIDHRRGIGVGQRQRQDYRTNLVAQNPFDLRPSTASPASTSATSSPAIILWELPFGHEKRWLTASGVARDVLGDWQWSGDWTIASGLPFTPRILGSFGDVNSGVNGTFRAERDRSSRSACPNPEHREWFNTAAFVAPPAGSVWRCPPQQHHRARQVVFDMAMTKSSQ